MTACTKFAVIVLWNLESRVLSRRVTRYTAEVLHTAHSSCPVRTSFCAVEDLKATVKKGDQPAHSNGKIKLRESNRRQLTRGSSLMTGRFLTLRARPAKRSVPRVSS